MLKITEQNAKVINYSALHVMTGRDTLASQQVLFLVNYIIFYFIDFGLQQTHLSSSKTNLR